MCVCALLYLLTGSGPHDSVVVLAARSCFQEAAVVVTILFRVFVLVCLRVNSAITHTFVDVALFRVCVIAFTHLNWVLQVAVAGSVREAENAKTEVRVLKKRN